MRKIILATLAAACLLVPPVHGEDESPPAQAPRPDNVSKFMQAKLDHSQELLRGLALEEYKTMEKHAQELGLLSHAVEWQVLMTPEYLQHSKDFRRSAEAVKDAAKKKNLDGAALGFVELTLKCVNCHRYVRKVRAASAPDDDFVKSLLDKSRR